MPLPLEEVLQYICIVFIGSKLPDKDWFLHHAKPLYVRSNKVRSALQWLKAHNPLYASVVLNEKSLSRLPAGDSLLPFYYELVEPDSRWDATTSRYDAQDLDDAPPPSDGIIPFHSVIISNVGQDTKIAFNIIQHHSMLQSVSFKTRHAWFKTVSSTFNAIFSDTAAAVAARLANNTFYDSPRTPQEQQVMSFMNHVQSVTRDVAGSNSGHMQMRNKVCALTFTLSVPAFFVTINLADVYNPIVRFMGGAEIELTTYPLRWHLTIMIRRSSLHRTLSGPELRNIAWAGCMAEGYLNPNELKIKLLATLNVTFSKRFLNYLEDCVQTAIPSLPEGESCVPADSSHPCSIRGINTDDLPTPDQIVKDLHLLVSSCQKHKHRATCFKYDPTSRECCFMLNPSASIPVSTIDPKTGKVTLRHEDGMCNNFNSTIIGCERCNMDVKPIISGEAAKAVMFYITDITKTQLKSHVAYAALESAMQKLEKGDVNVDGDTDSNVRGKCLLQKCAYEMLSRQELSAPQVASFLMDYEDHFSTWIKPSVPASPDDDAMSVVDLEEENGSASEDDLLGSSHTTDANSSDSDGSGIDLDDDVFLEQNEKGEITPRASQLQDYIFRGNLFSPVSL
ncbi:hypothetical protein DFP72DRAFT_1083001 [Ephemerocybe angulata]|uniref:Uncharacterized protein n=1 Tax=Ephemerocybe angulata TaxID=980116 RepID=A0A8H6LT97_9AGAR|nr:hypothetical protein DFP72DRAFT_1083001 [Tulosesus angulatus]